MQQVNERYFPEEEKITRHGFVTHMKSYIKELLTRPTAARPDGYLEKYGIDWKRAQEMLLKPVDKEDPESAVMRKEKKIITGPDGKDRFQVKYLLPRADFKKKMNKLFIDNFGKNVISELKLNEDGEGGAADGGEGGALFGDGGDIMSPGDDRGQYVAPFSRKPIKRTLYLTQEQVERLSEAVEMGTIHGDFGYDDPGLDTGSDFFKSSLNHKNIMKDAFQK